MNKTSITAYLIWSMILIISGIYITHKIYDKSNPSSLGSYMKQLKDADDENTQVP